MLYLMKVVWYMRFLEVYFEFYVLVKSKKPSNQYRSVNNNNRPNIWFTLIYEPFEIL